MCHEGRVALDRVAELEAQLAAERDALLSSASDVVGMDVRIKELEAALKEYANPDNWDNRFIGGGMNVWYGTDSDGYGLAHITLEKKP
jgi:hypothetical protein